MFNEIVNHINADIPLHFGSTAAKKKEQYIPVHYHDEIEILSFDSGSFSCTLEGKTFSLGAGDVIFINSRVPHSTYYNGSCIRHLIQINTSRLLFGKNSQSFIAGLLLNNKKPFYVFHAGDVETKELRTLIKSIKEYYFSSQPGSQSLVLGNLHILVGRLIQKQLISAPDEIVNNERLYKIAPVVSYIAENYKNDITVEMLASLLNLDKSYFCRLFKSASGKTSIEFLNNIRLHHAEALLKSTSKSITEIASETGFSSSAYFNRVFKRSTGHSPSHYRKVNWGM